MGPACCECAEHGGYASVLEAVALVSEPHPADVELRPGFSIPLLSAFVLGGHTGKRVVTAVRAFAVVVDPVLDDLLEDAAGFTITPEASPQGCEVVEAWLDAESSLQARQGDAHIVEVVCGAILTSEPIERTITADEPFDTLDADGPVARLLAVCVESGNPSHS